MDELYYRWGEAEFRDWVTPPTSTRLGIYVDVDLMWTGDVTEQLWAWMRWCALEMVSWWPCPEMVCEYLKTGDEALRTPANLAAGEAVSVARTAWIDSQTDEAEVLARTAWDAAAKASAASEGPFEVVRAAQRVSEAASDLEVEVLRSLVLRCAIPRDLWPLIDGDEGELCRALRDLA